MPHTDGDELRSDEHVVDLVERREDARDAWVVDVGGGVVPPARAGVHRAGHEPDRSRIRRRLRDDCTVERRRERRRDLETETTIAPSVRELRTVAEHVVPPAFARPGDGGEGIVVGRAPRLVGEEALQQLLQRRELVEIDTAERVDASGA